MSVPIGRLAIVHAAECWSIVAHVRRVPGGAEIRFNPPSQHDWEPMPLTGSAMLWCRCGVQLEVDLGDVDLQLDAIPRRDFYVS